MRYTESESTAKTTEDWPPINTWLWYALVLLSLMFVAFLLAAGMSVSELGGVWFLHLLIPVLIVWPIASFGYKEAEWVPGELLAFILPFLCWMMLRTFNHTAPKTLFNFYEVFVIDGAIVIAAILRVLIGKRREWFPHIVLVGLCGIAVAVFYLTPPIPE